MNMENGVQFILVFVLAVILFTDKWLQRSFQTIRRSTSSAQAKNGVYQILESNPEPLEYLTHADASINLYYIPRPPIQLKNDCPNNWYDLIGTFETQLIPEYYLQNCVHSHLPLDQRSRPIPVHMTKQWYTKDESGLDLVLFEGTCTICSATLHTLLLARA
jgi:hypothetical protein